MYDYLIVGAGLYGAVFAQQAKERGKTALVIDRRPHIAGNVYTETVEGIHVHRYGAHIFHTNSREAWDYVNHFAAFNRFTNSPVANYKGELYSLPFNMYTFNKMWGVTTPQEAAAEDHRAAQPGGAGDQPCGPRHLRKAHQGLHREAMGPPLCGAARLHHQAPARAPDLRQQLF